MMTTPDRLATFRSGFDEMKRLGIVIAPWLAMDKQNERLSSDQRETLHRHAKELSLIHNRGEILWWVSKDVPQSYREHAYYETLLSTAAYLSLMKLGTLFISDQMISVANRLVRTYVAQDGGSLLLSVYGRTMTYLNLQLLIYYGQVPEEVFLSGEYHRPWIDYPLTNELQFSLTHGLVEIVGTNGPDIRLTDQGRTLYDECRRDLEACGYLKQREQLMRATNFSNMDDYEALAELHTPDIHGARGRLLQWCDIQPGMRVLELGCGAGALTMDDGLYKLVGPAGRVVATDPSIGMLSRATTKLEKYRATNVELIQAGAEKIPFPDNTFDVVTGSLFLHFTDIPKALAEIHRVTKPGGVFATFYSLKISREPFLIEWFEPLFGKGLISSGEHPLPDESLVRNVADEWFSDWTCDDEIWPITCIPVENVVRFLVQAGTMAELNELPWKARTDLFDELIARGHTIVEKYGSESMKLQQPEQWFKGYVRK